MGSGPPPLSGAGRRRWDRVAFLAAGYLIVFVLLDTFSWTIERMPGVAAFFPSDGLALSLVYLLGWVGLPVVYCGYLFSTIVVHGFGDEPLMLLASGVGTALHGGCVYLIQRVLRADLATGRVRDLTRLLLAVAAVSAAGAGTIVGTLVLSGDVPREAARSVLFTAFTGLSTGLLMVVPLTALVAPRVRGWLAGGALHGPVRRPVLRRVLVDAALLLTATALMVAVAFSSRTREWDPLYLCFAPIIWFALRRGLAGAAVAILVMDTAVVIAFQVRGMAPVELDKIQLLQMALALTGLVLGAVVTERKSAQEEAQKGELLRQELELARRIQTEVLPPLDPGRVPGFDVAASVRTASLVGGDFYDILRTPNAPDGQFWVVIGDVSGHGLDAGLVTLMAQAASQATLRARPDAGPGQLVAHVNQVIYENVRVRMRRDDFVTFMALRHDGRGRFVMAGGHQPAFVTRAGGGVEMFEVRGPWMGLRPDIEGRLRETAVDLGPGDMMCVITDGVIETRNPAGEMFGEERLMAALRETAGLGAQAALDHVQARLDDFMDHQEDDITLVLLKRAAATAALV